MLVRSIYFIVHNFGILNCLLKDIINMERIQRCSTKYILNDYTSDYKARLLKLKLATSFNVYLLDLSDVATVFY